MALTQVFLFLSLSSASTTVIPTCHFRSITGRRVASPKEVSGIRGFFKRNESNLKEQFAKKWPDLVEYITWNSYTKAPSQNGITNGSRSKINVSFLSDVDGKGKIVTLTQSLAKAVSTGKLDPEEITDQLITEKLQVKGMPDPDLALIYGYSCSTHGLLPWHTRTTEFLMLPLYVRITVKDFAYVLERYSKCVQRYGK
ncbi:PREDICTED: dehydrodolichyl diphosphate syntase complex subunit NUS1 isoform X3 [Dinoponera quadriceps]|uniref:ditrans,polycis-polyprenyl diphosphate synthase [(2E,6E)-farnesyldiphosphate specific] n=1 Tax=Dinoponera quadriceps TaxID=609295 RepID=A0A6P3Y4N3_DINQU|nr:PREDICTED: dehydrodolichyl diphosphate syntase complex subunit NUS1 isoform X3 [Dinoponera quadriceps]